MRRGARRRVEFRALALFFALFVVFMYGPIIAIVILSFQGVDGGLTFPMNGVSLHWFGKLFEPQMVGDFEGSFARSFTLACVVMGLTVCSRWPPASRSESRFAAPPWCSTSPWPA